MSANVKAADKAAIVAVVYGAIALGSYIVSERAYNKGDLETSERASDAVSIFSMASIFLGGLSLGLRTTIVD